MPVETTEGAAEPRSLDQLIRAAMTAESRPITFAQLKSNLKQIGVPTTGKKKVTDETIHSSLAELVSSAAVFEHPGKKYSVTPPPPPPPPLTEQILATFGSEEKKSVASIKLGLPTTAKPADFNKALKHLVEVGQLFAHGRGKAQVYARFAEPVPAWHEVGPNAKTFATLVKNARALVERGVVEAAQLLALLRANLAPTVVETGSASTSRVTDSEAKVKPPVSPTNLRGELREAYEYLCRFEEFRDRLVEIRRLYFEMTKRQPGLSVADFHRELEAMSNEWLIELHQINEVQLAQDRHLAIERNDRLYYYIRWK